MNNSDRKELQKAILMLADARAIIESIGESETEKFDNLTEGLQASERGEKLSENGESLSTVSDTIQEQIDEIENIIA